MSTKIEELQTIEIVSYHDRLANSVAKMWSDSKEAWGGTGRTKQQVIDQQQASGNLDTFLAMVGNEVVGYCGFAVYKEDIGALYIPLLNVRPDYHGKKVGKLLLLHAIEQAIHSEWPRLDLYTWAGNLKAVPLYKRCGFFWEDDDQYTHLMNFMPSILKNPLLKKYLKNIDWYRDLQLEIEVKPDGELKNNFTFYPYRWKKDQDIISVKFEKTGRGISYIETKDFILELLLENHELIEETEQLVYVQVQNKTSEPLQVKIDADNQDRVLCHFSESILIEEKYTLEKPFTIQKGDKPIKGKTYPFIQIEVEINGVKTPLQLGISPKSPISIAVKEPEHILAKEMNTYLDLELENNLEEAIHLNVSLPKSDKLAFHEEQISISLAKDEKKWVRIPATVVELGKFDAVLACDIAREGKSAITYQKQITIGLSGIGYRFMVENETHWNLYNGTHTLSVDKGDNSMTLLDESFVMYAPSFGKPYSNELSKLKPYKVEAVPGDTTITMKLFFHSSELAGIDIIVHMELYAEGFIKRWITIVSETTLKQDFSLQETIYHDWKKVVMPMNDHIVTFDKWNVVEPVEIQSGSINGNWYFSEDVKQPIAFTWNENSKCSMDRWSIHIVSEEDVEPEKREKNYSPVYISIGAYRKWEDFQHFANKGKKSNKELRDELAISLNNNNCIYQEETNLDVELLHHKQTSLNGEIHYYVNNVKVNDRHSVSMEDGSSSYSINKNSLPLQSVNKWRTELLLSTKKVMTEDLILVPSGQIKTEISELKNKKVYSVSNGVLTFKASPDYYPGVYSLQVNGMEWLDHAFPEPTAKSWWNPWCGGIKMGPPDLNVFSLLKETSTCDFVERKDNHQNIWSGLRIETTIESHPIWKGLRFAQYFLALPGLPVFVTYVEVIENAGKRMSEELWHTNFFLTSNDHEKCELHLKNGMINQVYLSSEKEQSLHFSDETDYFISLQQEKMYYMTNESAENTEYYSNKETIQMITMEKCVRDNDRIYTKPNFLLFNNQEFNAATLRKLRRIKF